MGATHKQLMVLFGDQLDPAYLVAAGLDPKHDLVLMMEVEQESSLVPSHVQRTVLFLSAMRHHAKTLEDKGWTVDYIRLDDPANTQAFDSEIHRAIRRHKPSDIVCIEPGEWRVLRILEQAAKLASIPLRVIPDPHFLSSVEDFARWADGRRELTMEFFYREQRKHLRILMDENAKPLGGTWNLDKENRKSFKAAPSPPALPVFEPDDITREVIQTVQRRLPDLPGRIERFSWPVTRRQALRALRLFIDQRLPDFGDYQDAMWTRQDTLFHSVLSPALNLKLLNPREVVQAATEAYNQNHAPLNAVEGFIRQIIGWREFIRGIYWTQGEDYATRNDLEHSGTLPEFYWNGQTQMACMKDALRSVLDNAYGHHIARLMITGNFALIAGINPKAVSDWYLGMYADAIDWVTLPNTLGMALHADGGVVGTKPYAASGSYVQRMSNYCKECPYDVKQRTGEDACPFNTFYWDFLIRHRDRFSKNRRMSMILKHLDSMTREQMTQITVSARKRRQEMGIE